MGLISENFIDGNDFRVNVILSTAILEMYVKCGAVDEAWGEFDRMDRKDIVIWSTMVAGYAQNGSSIEVLEFFECMRSDQIKPNDVMLVSVLSACAQVGSVESGNQIGSYIESQDLLSNVYVASALVSIYSRLGNISKAREVFRMPAKDIVS
ncbi:putative pentatricopeptide repeat-containing protein At3g11460, mitochondrial [Jatropha curcas]|nr:putative pentatricopeptide repeat-containing protein At3g11460, mitochondrial [Jatropha curcas]